MHCFTPQPKQPVSSLCNQLCKCRQLSPQMQQSRQSDVPCIKNSKHQFIAMAAKSQKEPSLDIDFAAMCFLLTEARRHDYTLIHAHTFELKFT